MRVRQTKKTREAKNVKWIEPDTKKTANKEGEGFPLSTSTFFSINASLCLCVLIEGKGRGHTAFVLSHVNISGPQHRPLSVLLDVPVFKRVTHCPDMTSSHRHLVYVPSLYTQLTYIARCLLYVLIYLMFFVIVSAVDDVVRHTIEYRVYTLVYCIYIYRYRYLYIYKYIYI